jgi:hypothetical protein
LQIEEQGARRVKITVVLPQISSYRFMKKPSIHTILFEDLRYLERNKQYKQKRSRTAESIEHSLACWLPDSDGSK